MKTLAPECNESSSRFITTRSSALQSLELGPVEDAAEKSTFVDGGRCLGLSDICPSREAEAARDTGPRAGVG